MHTFTVADRTEIMPLLWDGNAAEGSIHSGRTKLSRLGAANSSRTRSTSLTTGRASAQLPDPASTRWGRSA
ncbi:hypothetical protein U2F26_31660 [Micromonospora sp. 4G57]|uniref:Uncharacterized protein n=1 Tax=Micromonospora sicca TaxID=2202420 RepID=A0ABU5JMX1_9ACTN|nr:MULTISPECIES: hypothetical protein [unclassified Micromonospora]MDZ5447217.1 hypothetical protein [Micromonospora sp. 4G57]MDZ5493916.1 hypothetical protein [Micromonospora sp. 4G53]